MPLANVYASIQGFQAWRLTKICMDPVAVILYHFDADVSVYTNWSDARLLTVLQ